MKFGVVNKSTTVNRFVLHTLQRNITHLAVITRKTNIKLGILKGGGGNWKRAEPPSRLLKHFLSQVRSTICSRAAVAEWVRLTSPNEGHAVESHFGQVGWRGSSGIRLLKVGPATAKWMTSPSPRLVLH